MAILERARVAAAPSPSTPAPAALADAELGDEELEQVVGGLERIYVPGTVVAADF